jgi:hypothetical protein
MSAHVKYYTMIDAHNINMLLVIAYENLPFMGAECNFSYFVMFYVKVEDIGESKKMHSLFKHNFCCTNLLLNNIPKRSLQKIENLNIIEIEIEINSNKWCTSSSEYLLSTN